jgi:hypothetical protein
MYLKAPSRSAARGGLFGWADNTFPATPGLGSVAEEPLDLSGYGRDVKWLASLLVIAALGCAAGNHRAEPSSTTRNLSVNPTTRMVSGSHLRVTVEVSNHAALLARVSQQLRAGGGRPLPRCVPNSAATVIVDSPQGHVAFEQFAPTGSNEAMLVRIARVDDLGTAVVLTVAGRVYDQRVARVQIALRGRVLDEAAPVHGWVAVAAVVTPTENLLSAALVSRTVTGGVIARTPISPTGDTECSYG